MNLEGPGGRPTVLKGVPRPIVRSSDSKGLKRRGARRLWETETSWCAPSLDPVSPEDTPLNPLCRSVSGGVVDREPSKLHVDPLTSERDPLCFEKPALTRPLCQRTVGAHDALPGDVGVLARRHHRAGESGRGGTQVAVGGDEAVGDRTGTPQHLTRAGGVEHRLSYAASE